MALIRPISSKRLCTLPAVITITLPPPGNLVGPGLSISATSDFIGPFPANSIWRFNVANNPEGTQQIWGGTNPVQNHSSSIRIADRNFNNQNFAQYVVPNTTSVHLLVTVEQPGPVVIDSGAVTTTWSTDAGLGTLSLITQRQIAAGGTGGFTEEDRVTLSGVSDAVLKIFAAFGGAQLVTGLSDFVTHPPVNFIGRITPCTLLSGSGTLNLPSGGSFGTPLGLVVTFESVPPLFGRRLGQVIEYEQRIAQFGAVHRLKNSTEDIITEFVDIHSDDFVWLWQSQNPLRLLYDITPGCVVSACFLDTDLS